MAVKTQCPRCKQPLAVPNKLAGSYANCPRCQGRFWISKDSPLDSSISDSVSMSGAALTLTQVPPGASAAPVATPPSQRGSGPQSIPLPGAMAGAPAGPPTPPRAYFPSVTPLAATPLAATPLPAADAAPCGPPTPPPPARKVARLVSADSAPSSLTIAADGQLPSLQLQDIDSKSKNLGKTRSISPLILIGVWVLSVVVTVAIFVLPSGSSTATLSDKDKAMQQIEDQYFGDPVQGLHPYQRLLREARQAHAREDFKAERQCYKQVLDLLRVESHGGGQAAREHLEKGVTGSHAQDQELERLIETVLKD